MILSATDVESFQLNELSKQSQSNSLIIEQGSGMGMKIAHDLATKAGGILTILKPQKGAHLKLTLPCEKIE